MLHGPLVLAGGTRPWCRSGWRGTRGGRPPPGERLLARREQDGTGRGPGTPAASWLPRRPAAERRAGAWPPAGAELAVGGDGAEDFYAAFAGLGMTTARRSAGCGRPGVTVRNCTPRSRCLTRWRPPGSACTRRCLMPGCRRCCLPGACCRTWTGWPLPFSWTGGAAARARRPGAAGPAAACGPGHGLGAGRRRDRAARRRGRGTGAAPGQHRHGRVCPAAGPALAPGPCCAAPGCGPGPGCGGADGAGGRPGRPWWCRGGDRAGAGGGAGVPG